MADTSHPGSTAMVVAVLPSQTIVLSVVLSKTRHEPSGAHEVGKMST
jgi:hypothetical protein